MKKNYVTLVIIASLFQYFTILDLTAQVIPVGSGSYTTNFPGTDAAGRNRYPSGSPQLSGNALGKPVPTNVWWSQLIKQDHAGNLFNYPLAMKTKNSGLIISYIPFGVLDDQEPIIMGVSGLNASKTTVSDYTDWTVSMDWNGRFRATSGIGMPFVYFEKGGDEVARVQINLGTVTVSNEMILVTDARNGADFAIYAPAGSEWIQNGSLYTSTLNGNNYWSIAMLPQNVSNPSSVALEYKKYAYVFPSNTTVEWIYDDVNSVMRTNFSVETDVKEGSETNMLLGLLPHQWGNLAPDSPQPLGDVYHSVRGDLKTLDGNSFSVENSFHGILPTLPYLSNHSDGFNPAALHTKVKLLENESLASWTDSYNEGQAMNRLIQTARIAHEMRNVEARDKIISTIKERLEDWLTAESGEVAFLFYYNENWSALLGYPAGHGQDDNINDHHFHWGYFIHAAAFLEQFDPGWVTEWGNMINLLVHDAASSDRSDTMFPFLRNFSPYAGHCWANGFATFPQGNDQESTSESMQFNSSLIHWGTITGNDEIRDLGIYLYTTEQSAIEEYWFDIYDRIFEESQPYSLVSRVWGNSYDNGTFWTGDIEASYGIELYPIHGGSMYLGHHPEYQERLWTEIENNTGILGRDDNVNLWHDVLWKYLAFSDPQKAINLYNNYPDRNLKFGVSDAQTYYWLHAMNALGQVDISVSSNYPLAAVFKKGDVRTYCAHNYSDQVITVRYSDGFELIVPARSMATNRDAEVSGSISSSFPSTYPGGSVVLSVNIENGSPGKVEFYKDGTLIGEDNAEPYHLNAEDLNSGVYNFYAKIYEGEEFNVTNIITVISGSQEPYMGIPSTIPGTLEAAHYDQFPGGKGQEISYFDLSPGNNGDFRTHEDVDAVSSDNEGSTIGWISDGEWLEYTVDVTSSGLYEVSFRYSSGNQGGGGPFYLELDGKKITDNILLSYSGDWDKWQTATISNIALPEGNHILRLVFDHGEFNLGKISFTYQ
ncbi:MAG: glycosyl hydrolase, partial [Bacteroidales bacterium]